MDANQVHDQNNASELSMIADELKRESDRLRQLAEELKQREKLQAEMVANYPTFKEFFYTELRKQFKCDPIPDDKDLETLAAEENAEPLESFIDEVESFTV